MSWTDWLPALLLLEDYGGDWAAYEQALYSHFFLDFVASHPEVDGQRVSYVREPLVNGREYTFDHLMSDGPESNRLPSLRRCERIRWPRAIIDGSGVPEVVVWRNQRRSGEALVLALADFSYKVVLMCRKGYFLLKAAYPVEFANERRDLEREYLAYHAATKG